MLYGIYLMKTTTPFQSPRCSRFKSSQKLGHDFITTRRGRLFARCPGMILNSIRWRLQKLASLILVIVLAGFGVTAYRVARGNQMRRIDRNCSSACGLLSVPHLRTKGMDGAGLP
jgi:hypothetical protein